MDYNSFLARTRECEKFEKEKQQEQKKEEEDGE